ncbi:MAG: pentapeptide repeat-containing protein [Desulfomonilaceae bacterium]
MNPEHVKKVKKVCLKSEAARAKLGSGPKLISACEGFWAEEFPASSPEHNKPLDLSDADLEGLVFVAGAPLTGANFRRANLDQTVWIRTRLQGADLTAASLRGCWMETLCDRTIFRDADLSGGSISLFGSMGGTEFVDLGSANLSRAVFVVHLFTPRVNLSNAKMEGCHVVFGELQMGKEVIKTEGGRARFLNSLSEEQSSQIVLEGKQRQSEEGNSSKSGQSGCFIATAAYRTYQAPDVVTLRRFRETVLRPSRFGRKFITAYEWGSPLIANRIKYSPLCRALVRCLIVRPCGALAEYLLAARERQKRR